MGKHQTDDWLEAVTDAVRVHLSPREVQHIEDKGQWMRRIIKVTFYDVACLRYPPFGAMTEARWAAFLRGYGPEPERKRVRLYAVMQRLCAAMGVYMEPASARNTAWTSRALVDLDGLLDEIITGE